MALGRELDIILHVGQWTVVELCLHFENNVAQFRPGQLPTSHSFKEGALEQPDQSLKLAAPPRRPAQVELPVDPFVC